MTVQGQIEKAQQYALANAQLTQAQELAIAKNPNLEAAAWGTQYDTLFKTAVNNDPFLKAQGIMTTPRGQFGPDVFNPQTQEWWDLTTPAQWNAHLQKYWLFGEGSPLFTK